MEDNLNRNMTCMYHPTEAPEGRDMTFDEAKKMGKGWVDTPAKFGEKPKEKDEKPDPVKVAKKLLGGEGLNMSSFMRGMGEDPKNKTERNKLQPVYDGLLDRYKDNIYKQNHDHFWK